MQRVMILGGPGSGKSTLAKHLGEATGLPVFHLDKLFWRPGWTMPPPEEFLSTIANIADTGRWITDGNYSKTFPICMTRADTIVWLDLPRSVCMARVLRRTLAHIGGVREDVAPGCPERINFEFFNYTWTFRKAHAAKFTQALATHGRDARLVVLRSRQDVRRFAGSFQSHALVQNHAPGRP